MHDLSRCRLWARIQLLIFSILMCTSAAVIYLDIDVSIFVNSVVIVTFGAVLLLLNIIILKEARCPCCSVNLIEGIGPLRLLPIFRIILGKNPLCKSCKEKLQ